MRIHYINWFWRKRISGKPGDLEICEYGNYFRRAEQRACKIDFEPDILDTTWKSTYKNAKEVKQRTPLRAAGIQNNKFKIEIDRVIHLIDPGG